MMDFNAEKYTKYIKTGYIDRYMGKSNRKKLSLKKISGNYTSQKIKNSNCLYIYIILYIVLFSIYNNRNSIYIYI